jgi:hypothetical protein
MKMPSFLETILSFLERGGCAELVYTVLCASSHLQKVMDLCLSKKSYSDHDFVRVFDTSFYTVSKQFFSRSAPGKMCTFKKMYLKDFLCSA